MKKKAIEKIPYFGLKETSRKKAVKYIGVTAVKIVGHERHLFLEIYRNKKKLKDTPVVRIVTTKKDFGTYYPEKRHMDQRKDRSRERMGQTHLAAEWRCIRMAANRKRESPAERGRSGKVKKIL